MKARDGNRMAKIPEPFVRRGFISIDDAVGLSVKLDPISLNLCASAIDGTKSDGIPIVDLEILQSLARWKTEHMDFLKSIRLGYDVELT